MIETGKMSHETLPRSPLSPQRPIDDHDTISNYYDTVDTVSNSISEIGDADFCDTENPLAASIIMSNDTASYETVYEDINPSPKTDEAKQEVIDPETHPQEEIHHDNGECPQDDDKHCLDSVLHEGKIKNENENGDEDENGNEDDIDAEFVEIEHNEDEKKYNHSHIESELKIMVNPMHDVDNKMSELLDDLQTGDVILCHGGKGDSIIDKGIEYFTHSPWEHAAMIIRDPWWINSKLEDGLYVFQSGWGPNSYPDVISGSKRGVTLNKLEDFLRNREGVYIRTLSNFELNGGTKFLFKTAFETAHGKPYDAKPGHWTAACLGSFFKCPCISRKMLPREEKEFWCSALVYFMYTKMEWTNTKTDWSCKTPNDLMTIKLEKPYELGKIWKLK